MRFRNCSRANTLSEYAIVLSIVAVALLTMNTYIKRGIQGKAKDLTDAFICNEQTGKLVRKDVASVSNTITNSSATVDQEFMKKGGFKGGITQTDVINATNYSEDYAGIQGYGSITPAEVGTPKPPVQPKPTSDPPAS